MIRSSPCRADAHVGDVLNIAHVIAKMTEIAHDDVHRDIELGVTDVAPIVDRRSADIHSNPPLMNWLEKVPSDGS
jgi:hypothetical protein